MPLRNRTHLNRSGITTLDHRTSNQLQILNLRTTFLKSPQTNGQVVTTMVVPNAFRDREDVLRSNVVNPLPELVPVDIDLAASAGGHVGGVGEGYRDWNVVAGWHM